MKQPDLDIGTLQDMAINDVQLAHQALADARTLFKTESYEGAANRLYYCIYRMVSAVHHLDNHTFRSHKDALGQFNKLYIKEQIFPRSYGVMIYEIQQSRHHADYGYNQLPTRDEIKNYMKFVKIFYEDLKNFCEKKLGKNISISKHELQR